MSLFWFDFLKDIVENHFITANLSEYPKVLEKYSEDLLDRSMVVRRTEAIPIECVARGYLAGSGWKEYKRDFSVCGINLPKDLQESEVLPEPIFTPATKAESGHDENISENQMANLIGKDLTIKLKDLTLAIYKKAADYASSRGIIIADTKLEFGLLDNKIILIDEVLTPDSSRFWSKGSYKVGANQPSFDKQYVRDYLETLSWDKKAPAPELSEDIISATSQKYNDAYHLLTNVNVKTN